MELSGTTAVNGASIGHNVSTAELLAKILSILNRAGK